MYFSCNYMYTYLNCEYILQFTYIWSPFVSLYAYRNTALGLADVFGQVILAITSFRYHNALYKQLKCRVKPDELDLCHPSIYGTYIADVSCIQLRTFLTVMVNLLTMENSTYLICNMAYIQLVAMYIWLQFSFDVKKDGNRILFFTGNKTYLSYVLYVPFVLTTVIFHFHNNDRSMANHVIISSLMIAVCMAMKPFHEMNHLFFHMLLYYQTYATSMVNAGLLS